MLLFHAFGRCFKYSKEITDITTNDPKDESLACVSQASRHLPGLVKARSPLLSESAIGIPIPNPKVRSPFPFQIPKGDRPFFIHSRTYSTC
ncbi:hypothetical protein QT992_06110 [Microcoleus sp. T3_D1]